MLQLVKPVKFRIIFIVPWLNTVLIILFSLFFRHLIASQIVSKPKYIG